MISGIVLIKIASCQNRNAPGLKITRRNVVARGRCPLVHRQDLAVSTRIKRGITSADQQRDIAGDSDTFKTWNRSQRGEQLLYEALTRLDIRILCRRQSNEANPNISVLISDVLLIETNKTRDQQCGPGEQRHRERDLRADEDFSEALLLHAAAYPATAFLKPIYQIAVRALKGRIDPHQQSRQNRQPNCKAEHRKREVDAYVRIERQKIRGHF